MLDLCREFSSYHSIKFNICIFAYSNILVSRLQAVQMQNSIIMSVKNIYKTATYVNDDSLNTDEKVVITTATYQSSNKLHILIS